MKTLESTIFSIGHGNKTLDELIEELKTFNIEFLFDVRSSPISKFNPQFNQPVLNHELPKKAGITYVFLGDYLGGLPKDQSCYTNGKVDYAKVVEKDFFKEGMKLLVEAYEERIKIALMCSESNPGECHRSKLIGQELNKLGISIIHILPNEIKDQKTVIDELTKGKNPENLFGESSFTSRKTYI